MYLFQLLLPLQDNSGEPYPPKEFDALKNELASEHGGVTAHIQAPAEGLWRQDAGETDRDQIVIFEVITEQVDLQRWRRRRADLERRLRQEQIIIRYWPLALV